MKFQLEKELFDIFVDKLTRKLKVEDLRKKEFWEELGQMLREKYLLFM